MVSWDIAEAAAGRVEIRRTPAGRVLDAVRAFLGGAALGGAGGAAYYAIDRVGRGSAGVEIPQGYLLAVAALAVAAGVVAVVWRTMRQRRWIFDAGAGVVALVWERSFGTSDAVEVALSELRDVRFDTAGLGGRSAVVAVFGDGEEAVATTRLGPRQLAPIHAALTTFLTESA